MGSSPSFLANTQIRLLFCPIGVVGYISSSIWYLKPSKVFDIWQNHYWRIQIVHVNKNCTDYSCEKILIHFNKSFIELGMTLCVGLGRKWLIWIFYPIYISISMSQWPLFPCLTWKNVIVGVLIIILVYVLYWVLSNQPSSLPKVELITFRSPR